MKTFAFKFTALILTTLVLTACQSQQIQEENTATALWKLHPEESQLSFISTKNKSISESHTIAFHNGQINSLLALELTLDLNQVETQIPIRNQRLRDLLFETEIFPTAQIQAQLPKEIKPGSPITLDFNLKLHGTNKKLQTTVLMQLDQTENEMVVISYNPILINAKDFGLDNGINKLTQVAQLNAISYEVPVEFKLVFQKQLINN